jgi:hypothetical protein
VGSGPVTGRSALFEHLGADEHPAMLILDQPIPAETPPRADGDPAPTEEQECSACAAESCGLCIDHRVLVLELL